jgi:hypothetical protein
LSAGSGNPDEPDGGLQIPPGTEFKQGSGNVSEPLILSHCQQSRNPDMGSIDMRSTFCGIGLFVLMWGSLFLFTEQLEIRPHQSFSSLSGWWTSWNGGQAVFHPPEWAAFSLLSAGSLMVLYAIGLPKRKKNWKHKRLPSGFEELSDPYYGRLTQSLIRVRATSSPRSRRQC